MSPRTPDLPCSAVRFEEDFLRRALAQRARLLRSRELREGAGSGSLGGGGEEFSGHRPYRPGEDLRQLDWSLYARLDKPFVRVTRREAEERWSVLVDASASMGVGPPGKLQRAAECAACVALLGQRAGAHVLLIASGGEEPGARRLEVGERTPASRVLEFLEGLEAAGARGLATLLESAAPTRGAGRVYFIGDLFDLEPRALLSLARPGRVTSTLQLLAPAEFDPGLGARRLRDAESLDELVLDVDQALRAEYLSALEARLEAWRAAALRHGARYACRSTRAPFEDLASELLGA